jgi:hypothetical protein
VRRALFALALLAPASLVAQVITVRAEPGSRGAAAIESLVANRSVPYVTFGGGSPGVVPGGDVRFVLPRDSVVRASLLIFGRPTYIASTVLGDVVIVGADLFLRPGADIRGRAVAIGGTVAQSDLGHVGGDVLSLPDETFDRSWDGRGYVLTQRSLRVEETEKIPVFQLGGFSGLGLPQYDRVDGLSLPVVGLVTLANGGVVLEPSVTYRSRLGTLDPAVALRIGDTAGVHFVGRAARDTRTNDGWIYGDIINSLLALGVGSDMRNYFRSEIGEGRLYANVGGVRPFVGARYERVTAISAAGNVFSFFGRHSLEHMARPNPLVDDNDIGSVLVGAEYLSTGGVVESALGAHVEQSVHMEHGPSFTQLTVHGTVSFPTFRDQSLHIRAHGVATRGDSVPLARYAYLGGSGTLGLLDPLEFGGTSLLFVESRYVIPVDRVTLPYVGVPVLTLRHLMGGAGVGSLGEFQQEVGVGLGLSVLRLDYTVGAGGRSGHDFGVGISLGL